MELKHMSHSFTQLVLTKVLERPHRNLDLLLHLCQGPQVGLGAEEATFMVQFISLCSFRQIEVA